MRSELEGLLPLLVRAGKELVWCQLFYHLVRATAVSTAISDGDCKPKQAQHACANEHVQHVPSPEH
jgi:hypothetical protein